MSEQDKISHVRAEMPAVTQNTYLNTGTCGPMSQTLVDQLNRHAQHDFTHGRASVSGFATLLESMDKLRHQIGTLINADTDEIAITHHTTEGMNIIIHGLQWQPGDEVIATTVEHEGGLIPLYVLAQRYGVVIRMVEIDPDDDDDAIVRKIDAAMTDRTKLALVSHVSWNLGTELPIRAIADAVHGRDALLLVDAAQSIGAIPVDMDALGADFYAMPGQKWLCGPEGIGFLYVRRSRLSLVNLTFAGFLSLRTPMDWDFTGQFMAGEGAKRFEVGSVYRPAVHAMASHLEWMGDHLGWPWIFDRIRSLNEYAYEAIGRLPKVEMVTDPGPQSSLTCFNLNGYDPARITAKLADEGTIVRFLGHPYCLRVSVGFYNTKEDIDRVIAQLTAVTEMDPDELPAYVSPFD